eukprot:scaffold9972_cov118-Isochrysis_galbana.AAC.5
MPTTHNRPVRGRVREPAHRLRVRRVSPPRHPGGRVPCDHLARLLIRREDQLLMRREAACGSRRLLRTLEAPNHLSSPHIPEPHIRIAPAGEEHLVAAAKADGADGCAKVRTRHCTHAAIRHAVPNLDGVSAARGVYAPVPGPARIRNRRGVVIHGLRGEIAAKG